MAQIQNPTSALGDGIGNISADTEHHSGQNTSPNTLSEKKEPLAGSDPLPTETRHDLVSSSGTESKDEYPSGINLALIIGALASSVFLVALDETIIATAIPRITDHFGSLSDVGWYGSAYFLTMSSFQLVYGKFYSFFPVKWVFFISIAIFEIGSLVCALSPNSFSLIIGRAISGLGSSGINAGFIIILAKSMPLEKRPTYVATYSSMYGLARLLAPIMGGAFTDHLTWRLCFYINLPFGVITMAIAAFFLNTPSFKQSSDMPLRKKIKHFDILGTAILLGGITSLLLALQWGGSKYAWSSGRVIAPLVLAGVCTGLFIVVQWWKQDLGTVPPRIIKYRSVAFSSWHVFNAGAAINLLEYFLPIWFQAIKGVTALQSGVSILPSVFGMVLFAFIAGFGVRICGYYTPFMIAGSAFLAIGAGLVSTWKVNSGINEWFGYQVLIGIGGGLGIQQAHTAAQRVLPEVDVPTGAVVIILAQIMGGTIYLSVAQNVFLNRLVKELESRDIVGVELRVQDVVATGATRLRDIVSPEYLPKVLSGYNAALTQTYYIAVALACLSMIGALGTEWKSVKKRSS